MEVKNTVTAQVAANFIRSGWETGNGLNATQEIVRQAMAAAANGVVTLPQDVVEVVVAWEQAATKFGA